MRPHRWALLLPVMLLCGTLPAQPMTEQEARRREMIARERMAEAHQRQAMEAKKQARHARRRQQMSDLQARLKKLTHQEAEARAELAKLQQLSADNPTPDVQPAIRQAIDKMTEALEDIQARRAKTAHRLRALRGDGESAETFTHVPVPPGLALWRKPADVSARDHFLTAPAGCGTVHPLATVVKVPMGKRIAWVAIDASKPGQPRPDVVRFTLTDPQEQESPVIRFDERNVTPLASDGTFGPAKMIVPAGSESAPFLISGAYTRHGDHRRLQLSGHLAMRWRTPVTLGGKNMTLWLIDGDWDFTFDRNPRPGEDFDPFFSGDTLMLDPNGAGLDKPGQLLRVFWGQPVPYKGRLWHVSLVQGGFKASPMTDEQLGKLHVSADTWYAVLVTKQRVLNVTGGREPILLPADTYRIVKFGAGGGNVAVTPRRFTVQPGQTQKLTVQTPSASRRPRRETTESVQ